MRSSKFTITLKGDEADDSLRLSDLIDQLNAVRQTLNQVDVSISGKKSPSLYYRVTRISMNSPAVFEVEAISRANEPRLGRRVVSKLDRDLRKVLAGKRPRDADLDLMESYGGLVRPLRNHVAEITFNFEGTGDVPLPRNLDATVEEILGPDQVERGSVVGSLDAIDIHNDRNVFKIYPSVGPSSIKCHFPRGMLGRAVAGMDHFVKVVGELHFKRTEKFPHLIKVSSIDLLPERSDAPSLASLRGLAPDAYGGLSSTEYVEKMRHEEW